MGWGAQPFVNQHLPMRILSSPKQVLSEPGLTRWPVYPIYNDVHVWPQIQGQAWCYNANTECLLNGLIMITDITRGFHTFKPKSERPVLPSCVPGPQPTAAPGQLQTRFLRLHSLPLVKQFMQVVITVPGQHGRNFNQQFPNAWTNRKHRWYF